MKSINAILGYIEYFSGKYFLTPKNKTMKTAETLLHYMDSLQKIVGIINSYLEKGIEIFRRVKMWVEKVIDYIEQAIDALVQSIGGRKSDSRLMTEDYLFV